MSKKRKKKQKTRRPMLQRRLFLRFIAELVFWNIMLWIGLMLFNLLICLFQDLDFQWLYDISPGVYYFLSGQFYSVMRGEVVVYIIIAEVILILILVYRLLRRSVGYLDKLTEASQGLLAPETEQIALPPEMKEFELQLNQLKQTARINEENAREAEQRKNDLVVYLAHDLKTPLTSVIGYLTLMQDEPQLSTELRSKYTGIALRKAERLEELINEFFEITRFNLTHIELSLQTINLTRLLEQTASEFAPLLSQKDLTLDLKLQKDVKLTCDPDKMERVFDNLFRNAISYSYPSKPIAVSLTQTDDTVTVQIDNCGRTRPPEKLSHIFEQFFRADPARSTEAGGTGIGLAVAKEITQLHGGKISAESADEHITFTVTLPKESHKIV